MHGRYVEAFSWRRPIENFLRHIITENPLLHVCSGPHSRFGDVRVDRYVVPHSPGVQADWLNLPFRDDSFAAVFADPPWGLANMKDCGEFCQEGLRVARVLYVMSPWLWVNRMARRSKIWAREFPGINVPILIVRYERDDGGNLELFEDDDGR
jgi:hypothetical protein